MQNGREKLSALPDPPPQMQKINVTHQVKGGIEWTQEVPCGAYTEVTRRNGETAC